MTRATDLLRLPLHVNAAQPGMTSPPPPAGGGALIQREFVMSRMMNLVSAACMIQSEACVATTRSRGSLTVQSLASCQELTDWKRTFNWVMQTEVSVAGMVNMLGTPPGHQPLNAAQLLLGTNQRGQSRLFYRCDVYARLAVVSSWPVSRSFKLEMSTGARPATITPSHSGKCTQSLWDTTYPVVPRSCQVQPSQSCG